MLEAGLEEQTAISEVSRREGVKKAGGRRMGLLREGGGEEATGHTELQDATKSRRRIVSCNSQDRRSQASLRL